MPAIISLAAWREPRLRVLLPAAAAFLAVALASRSRGAIHVTPPGARGRSPRGLLLLACLTGALLVAMKFPVREHYYDTARQVAIGQQTREHGFLVTHGQRSGAGVDNPPLFAYVMGVLTAATTDPEILAATVTAANLAALAAASRFFSAALPHPFGIIAIAVMATAQATVDYSVLLWEGSLLIPLAVVFQVFLCRFLTIGGPRDFVGLSVAAGLSAQCHQSGILLYPLVAVIALSQRRRIGIRAALAAAGSVLFLSAPYLHYLLAGGGLERMGDLAEEGKRASLAAILNVNAGMVSPYFTYYPFQRIDLKAFLTRAAGPAAWALYLASLAVTVAFLAGWVAYLGWAVSRRRIFSRREEDTAAFPVPFQAAGFTLTALTILYAVSARYIWYKHFLVAFPAHALLASWTIWRLWGSRAARALFVAAIAAGVIVTAGIYREIARAGGTLANGTINKYGPGYASYKRIRDEVWRAVAPGHAPRLFLRGVWATSLQTVVFPDDRHEGLPGEAVMLDVRWDPADERFVWVAAPVQGLVERHARALRRAAGMPPAGAAVAGTDLSIHALNPAGGIVHLKSLLPPGSRWIPFPSAAAASEAEWIVVDTADPRALVPARGADAWDLLAAGRFGLVSEDGGLYVFRRGADAAAGREFLARGGLPFREFLVHGRRGGVAVDPDATFGLVRRCRAAADAPGPLLDLPLPELPPGRYEAVVRFRRTDRGSRVGITVAGGADGTDLAQHEALLPGPAGDGWEAVTLPFDVGAQALAGARLRVTVSGPGEVSLDAPRLRFAKR